MDRKTSELLQKAERLQEQLSRGGWLYVQEVKELRACVYRAVTSRKREDLEAAARAYDAVPRWIIAEIVNYSSAMVMRGGKIELCIPGLTLTAEARADAASMKTAGISRRDDPDEQSQLDLLHEADWISGLLERSCREDDPIRKRFDSALAGWTFTSDPDMKEIAAAVAAFYALPLAKRQRILRGWTPMPSALSTAANRRDLEEIGRSERIGRVLYLGVHHGSVLHVQEVRLVEGGEAVAVTVNEGTTKREVLAQLRKIARAIDAKWEDMIGDDTGVRPNEEGGAPETPLAHEPASNTSMEAMTSTAA